MNAVHLAVAKLEGDESCSCSAVIQFGYVTFFSWAFPLAPLCALINNVVEMRTDAYKLCHNTQRPIAHKASGIGAFMSKWWVAARLCSFRADLSCG